MRYQAALRPDSLIPLFYRNSVRAAPPHPTDLGCDQISLPPKEGCTQEQRYTNLHRGGGDALGGLFDKRCDSPGLRHVDGVAALDLDDR